MRQRVSNVTAAYGDGANVNMEDVGAFSDGEDDNDGEEDVDDEFGDVDEEDFDALATVETMDVYRRPDNVETGDFWANGVNPFE